MDGAVTGIPGMGLTRRAMLGAAALALGACARVSGSARPTPSAQATVLHVRADPLALAAPALQAAWRRAHPRINLNIRALDPIRGFSGSFAAPGDGHSVAGLAKDDDIFQIGGDGAFNVAGEVLDLTPLLRARNFTSSTVGGLASFTLAGRQFGLPLWVEPLALLANAANSRRA